MGTGDGVTAGAALVAELPAGQALERKGMNGVLWTAGKLATASSLIISLLPG